MQLRKKSRPELSRHIKYRPTGGSLGQSQNTATDCPKLR
ncbi:hypothetical protein BU14_1599s0004 [Porphyra umbilicalis]|uniref:Uncharacterized protein n=1 Tax=Porphyra umbilicalis TaxID=2786 RepID=A0A1X6NLA6_PORUM|nr:hypothetical protein BU14_1599s0004 [Porphyra umbilicalis]|eukprot:OSX69352.1 hypothetical protein BU14_1599s0004 [Porphyra umbilicalis]